jgi:hypothetical protein
MLETMFGAAWLAYQVCDTSRRADGPSVGQCLFLTLGVACASDTAGDGLDEG